MNDTQRTRAAQATQNGLLRHDRVAEAPTDTGHPPGDAARANSPRRQTVTVGQVMRPPTTTIEPSAHLAAAAYLIEHSHDSALLVTDDNHELVAMIADAEIARAIAEGQDLEDTRVSHLARENPLTVEADLDVADAARLMLSKGIRRVPVVEERRLVGMVDLADLCRTGSEARTACGGGP